MPLLPRALRPSVIIRRKAIWLGLLGPSRMWKAIAVIVFGQSTIKKFFGKSPEKISTQRIGFNTFVNVINAKPMTKQQQKAAGITKADIRAQASSDVAAAWARKAAAQPRRKVVRRAKNTAAIAAADRRAASGKTARPESPRESPRESRRELRK